MTQPSLFDDDEEQERKRKFPDTAKDLQFSGSDYEPRYDQVRLTGQLKRIWDLMLDGHWRTLSEIEALTGTPHSSVSAQLRNLRKAEFGSHDFIKRSRGNRSSGLWEMKVIPNAKWVEEQEEGT